MGSPIAVSESVFTGHCPGNGGGYRQLGLHAVAARGGDRAERRVRSDLQHAIAGPRPGPRATSDGAVSVIGRGVPPTAPSGIRSGPGEVFRTGKPSA